MSCATFLAGCQLRLTVQDLIVAGVLRAAAYLLPLAASAHFGASIGLPPHAWLTALRNDRAQEMMTAHPTSSLIEIALSIGYQSPATYGVAFKHVVGATPSERRQMGRT